jgi:hypothetical protein
VLVLGRIAIDVEQPIVSCVVDGLKRRPRVDADQAAALHLDPFWGLAQSLARARMFSIMGPLESAY